VERKKSDEKICFGKIGMEICGREIIRVGVVKTSVVNTGWFLPVF
jgi:hypothetical protein